MIQNHVDLLSGKVHAVHTHSTATAADSAAIIRDMCLRSGDGFPDVLAVDHGAKFTRCSLISESAHLCSSLFSFWGGGRFVVCSNFFVR